MIVAHFFISLNFRKLNYLFHIEINEILQGLLAYRTELLVLVCAHSAVGKSAPNALALVTASFYKSSLAFVDEVLPLLAKVCLGGDVWLPRFSVGEIHRVSVGIFVFVSKSSKTVSKFMYHYRTEKRSLG